jgi:hypothetical protein
MSLIVRSIFSPWTVHDSLNRIRLLPSTTSSFAHSYLNLLRERLSAYYSIRKLVLLPNYRIRFIGSPLKVSTFWGGGKKGMKASDYGSHLMKIAKEINETAKKTGGSKKKIASKVVEEKYAVEDVELKKD